MPQLPVFTAGPAALGRRADAGDFGGAEAQAAGQRAGVPQAIGEVTDRIYTAQQDAKIARVAAESAAALDETTFQLETDPDLDSHEKKFEEARSEIAKKAEAQLPNAYHGELETRLFTLSEHARMRVRANVRAQRIDSGRADLVAMSDTSANLAGRSPDPRDRDQIEANVTDAFDTAQRNGLIDRGARDLGIQEFHRKTTEALARAGKNDHPEATLAALKGRTDGFGKMDEPRRQEWIEVMTNEIQQRERVAKAEKDQAEAKAEKAKREIQDGAVREGYFAAADGTMDLDWVKENRDKLPTNAIEYFIKVSKTQTAQNQIPDPLEYYRQRAMQAENPEAFEKEKIDPASVGAKKAIELLDAQAKIRKEGPVLVGDFRVMLNRRVKALQGVDDNERAQIFRAGEESLEDFERLEKKGRSTPKEQESIIDQMLLERTRSRPGGWFTAADTEVLPVGEPVNIPDVPEPYVPQIIDSLKRQGRPVTPEAIRERFEKAKALGLVK